MIIIPDSCKDKEQVMAGRAQEGVVGVMNLAVVTHFELKMQEYASGIHAIFHELPLAGGQSSGDFLVGLL